MNIYLALLAVSAIAAAARTVTPLSVVKAEWMAFKLFNRKSFPRETEDLFRMKVFTENKHYVAMHNAFYAMKQVPYQLANNEFSDMAHHEFCFVMNGYNKTARYGLEHLRDSKKPPQGVPYQGSANMSSLPDHIDWRKLGAVTAVKNQGRCGSCWSFSATGALEGQNFRKTGQLVALSEQNLIDCTVKYGNDGCNGGFMRNAFKYVKENAGLDTEMYYPYQGYDNRCRYNPRYSDSENMGFVEIPEGDEAKLQHAVASVGPVAVTLDNSPRGFQFYSKGVFYDPYCSSTNLNHGVLVVGYGTDKQGGDYWLVKNSWGKSWGEDGYIRIARNRGNHCGIASRASYPLV